MEVLFQPHARLLVWTAIAFGIAALVGAIAGRVIGPDLPLKPTLVTGGVTAMVMSMFFVLAAPGLLEH